MLGAFLGQVRDMFGVCSGRIQDLFGMCSINVRDVCGVYRTPKNLKHQAQILIFAAAATVVGAPE